MAIGISKSFLLGDEAEEACSGAELVDDRALLVAFEHGNRNAFGTLYKKHAPAVFRFAFYMAGDADKADEITQEVFVWLIRHAAAFDPRRGTLPAFLGGVARKFLRRHARAERRWLPLEDAICVLRAVSISNARSPGAETTFDAVQVRQAVALLPIRYREVIVLCDLQEIEYAEAAETLGCSVGTIRSRLHRARALLARKLKSSNTQGGRYAL
jgi:RNA polymerase sigma-70 factor (ECF subfamily)